MSSWIDPVKFRETYYTAYNGRLLTEKFEEAVLLDISSNKGRDTTNPDVGQAATLSNNINDGSLYVSNHRRSTTDPMDGFIWREDFLKEDSNLASLDHFFNGLEAITSLDGLSEGNDGTPNRLNDQSQERKDGQKELIKSILEKMSREFQELEGPNRSMLQDLKSTTVNICTNLRKGVHRLKDSLYLHFDEMMRSVRSFSNSAPKARKFLPNSIGRLIDMCKGDVQHLLQETNTLIMTLGNFEKQLDARELSLEDCFKKCSSSIYLSVESSLCKQNSNNI